MSDIHVHIERLLIEGFNLSSMDSAVVQASLSSAVERHLLSDARGRGLDAVTNRAAHATLRAPSIDATTNHLALGERAGRSLAKAIGPVCLEEPSTKGAGRG